MRHSLRRDLQQLRKSLWSVGYEVLAELRFGGALGRAAATRNRLKLNIGCGANVESGWLNLDAFYRGKGILYFNALNPFPIPDGAVRRIHCEHFLEHLDFDYAVAFLRECFRVLEGGGTMRIVVPDADKYIEARANRNAAFFQQLSNIGNPSQPLATDNMVINQMFRMGGDHRYAWDFETLSFVTGEIGFGETKLSAINSAPAEFAIDGQDDWREAESFYAELTR